MEQQALLPSPGLVGEIAKFLFDQAPTPFPEMAIAAALAFFSGIVGRAYNVEGMGLNLYIILLAATSAGKNGAKTGIDKLYNALELMLRGSAVQVRRGLGAIASPEDLIRFLAGSGNMPPRLCSVFVLGEFGHTFASWYDRKASPHQKAIRRTLLDLYTSSGGSRRAGGVSYSDATKNVPQITAPAFSFIGDSTQVALYKGLTEDAALKASPRGSPS